jgi:uncharacterized protein YcbK (DUF882 family)
MSDLKLYFLFKKGELVQLSKNFNSLELQCKCRNPECVEQRISKDLVDNLQKLREEYGKSITVTSGYRCLKHNRSIGSVDNSQHVPGNAVDITGADLNAIYAIAEKYFDAVGDSRTKGRFVHLDTRRDKKRRWNY